MNTIFDIELTNDELVDIIILLRQKADEIKSYRNLPRHDILHNVPDNLLELADYLAFKRTDQIPIEYIDPSWVDHG